MMIKTKTYKYTSKQVKEITKGNKRKIKNEEEE